MRHEETAVAERPIATGQAEQDGQTARDAHAEDGRLSEARTTASDGRFCDGCGCPLKGRKKRFCSDRCRMRARRTRQAMRIAVWLASMEKAIAALKHELLNETKAQQ